MKSHSENNYSSNKQLLIENVGKNWVPCLPVSMEETEIVWAAVKHVKYVLY